MSRSQARNFGRANGLGAHPRTACTLVEAAGQATAVRRVQRRVGQLLNRRTLASPRMPERNYLYPIWLAYQPIIQIVFDSGQKDTPNTRQSDSSCATADLRLNRD